MIGHFDTEEGAGVFERVPSLDRGAPIDVTDNRGAVHSYRVVGVTRVRKRRFPTEAVYGHSRHPVLVLVTCGGPFRRAADTETTCSCTLGRPDGDAASHLVRRGAPSLDIVAVDELRAAAQRAFENDPGGTTAYGTAIGYVPLREWIAEYQQVAPEQVVVTNGSMQADAFLFRLLVEPGDLVIVEAPSYDRTLLNLRELGAELMAIPLEEDGVDVEAIARACEAGARPKLAHIIPNFHNPGGYTLSLEKRRRLLDLAKTYDFVVFEDDPYVELRFEGETLPTMLSLDDADRVVYASSFSKTVCPGIRVGYLAGPGGADRRRREDGDEHLHLAEHGVAVDRERVLPLRRARGLDRDGQERAPRAARRAVRGARARAAGRVVQAARGRLLPVGRPARGRRRGAARRGRQGARRRVRARAPTSCSRAARTACGSPTRA